jgi:hypothetical protein
MAKRKVSLVLTLGAAAVLAVGPAGRAWAHEERTIGKYHVAVGFGDEPAYSGQKNSVQMLIKDASDQAVTDLGPTLQVEVSFGGQAMAPLTMEPDFEVGEFGTPGDYRAFFFPTRPGDYTFHFSGTIKGQQVDETFTSGPDTFSSVQDPSQVEFPAKDPTTGQLAQRLDREIPRAQRSAEAAAARASDQAHSAKTLGIVGIVVGVVGILVAGVALITSRRPRTQTSADTHPESPGGGS